MKFVLTYHIPIIVSIWADILFFFRHQHILDVVFHSKLRDFLELRVITKRRKVELTSKLPKKQNSNKHKYLIVLELWKIKQVLKSEKKQLLDDV